MTDTNKLKDIIDKSGLKLDYLAGKLGISRQSFWMKINNVTEFKASEIQMLCLLLSINDPKIKEDIFFA